MDVSTWFDDTDSTAADTGGPHSVLTLVGLMPLWFHVR